MSDIVVELAKRGVITQTGLVTTGPDGQPCANQNAGVIKDIVDSGVPISGGGVDNLLIKPTYPVEIPWVHTNVSQVVYSDVNEPTVVPYTYMPDETVYIIGKKNDAYTLIGTLPTEGIGEDFSRDVSAIIWAYGQEIEYNPAHFESDIIDTNENSIGRITVGVTYDIFEEGEEPIWAWVSYVFTDDVQAYDSLIFDTEYNTTKYPES